MRLSLLLFVLLPCSLQAQTISLPLEGFYRPGAYMPVWVNSHDPLSLWADGAVTTKVPVGTCLAPVFVYSAVADELRCGDQIARLHALADEDRLIGCTTRDDALIAALFNSQHVIAVDLNAANSLTGPPLAWDSLDAAIVDSIDPQKIAALLATGMIIAVRSDAKPDNTWPWQRVADAWVLRPPTSDQPSRLGEEAYAPTFAWRAERPRAARQLVVIVALLASCLMLSLALLRSRWNLIALATFCAIFCIAFFLWRRDQSDVMTITREDRIAGEVTQIDRWTYQMSPVASAAQFDCDAITWPVFASSAHAASVHAVLDFDPAGASTRIQYTLPANARMTFVTRSCSTGF